MTDKTTPPPAQTPAADLSHLLSEAQALESAAAPPDQAEQQQVQQAGEVAAQCEEMADALDLVFAFAGPVVPERYLNRYDERARKRISDTWGPLAVKRGWNLGSLVEGWGPEIAFFGALIMPAVPVVMQDLKDRQQQAAGQQQRPPQPIQGVAP